MFIRQQRFLCNFRNRNIRMSTSLTKSRPVVRPFSQRVYHMLLFAVARDIAREQLSSPDSNQVKQEISSSGTNPRSKKWRNSKLTS